ncbi:MAG: R.Pab1 family restriction endonuclease [Ruminococcaceae bacterium]|nr:R.Pab1 family restriction endonuclease [Oscillospiraceae bacterium]
MFIKRIDESKQEIFVAIPLTKVTGKTRIKKRSILNQYGEPVATRQIPFCQNCYVEWQIGYDVKTSDNDKLQQTTLKDLRFIGANGSEKALYELSEYIKYFFDWNIIEQHDLEEVERFLRNLDSADFLDNPITHPELAIKRTNFTNTTINGFEFLRTQVEYPLLVHRFGNFQVITEIQISEKQKAVGIQPMLYFCFPITELEDSASLLGRTANQNEFAEFKIDKNNILVFVEMLKLFGTLSTPHNSDAISIIQTILRT